MLESFVQFVFLIYKPEQASRWTRKDDKNTKTPGMAEMCNAIKADPDAQGETGRLPALVDEIYDAWDLMSKGAHPTGLGLLQTEGESNRHHLIGAIYRPDLCLVGFDVGLHAVAHLLPMPIMWTRPETREWAREWYELDSRVEAWRAKHREEVDRVIDAWSPERKGTPKSSQKDKEPPPDDAEPSKDDLQQCRRIIQTWEDNMNRMPSGPSRKKPR
jgi:hypothetical protein